MDQTGIILITIAVFILITVIFIRTLVKRKQKNQQAPIRSSDKGSGTMAGIPFQWKIVRGSQNTPPQFILSLPSHAACRLSIRQENKMDGWCKRWGLCRETATMDPDFDHRFFINTPHPRTSADILSRRQIRQAVMDLFDRGFTQINQDKGSLKLVWSPYRPKDSSVSEEEIPHLVSTLIPIRQALLDCHLSPTDISESRTWKNRRILLYSGAMILTGAAIAFLIAGLSLYPPLDKGALFLSSLRISVPALVIAIYFCFVFIKGRASSHTHFFILTGILLFALILGTFGTKTFLNGKLDRSVSASHTARVLNKRISRSKNSRTYYLYVQSWRRARQLEKQKVSARTYEQAIPGRSLLTFSTRSGHYGFEWVESFRFTR